MMTHDMKSWNHKRWITKMLSINNPKRIREAGEQFGRNGPGLSYPRGVVIETNKDRAAHMKDVK